MPALRAIALVALCLLAGGCGQRTAPIRVRKLPPKPAPTPRNRNAALCYADALCSYMARREHAARRPDLAGIVHEPPIAPRELNALLRGAQRPDCDFYGGDRIVLQGRPGDKPWVFVFAGDPFEFRPYAVPVRRLAQAALNEGERRVNSGRPDEARRIFGAVAAFGAHIRRHPGSLIDVQVGLDVERRALHYLLALDNRLGRKTAWRTHARQDAALRAEQDAFVDRYASLDDIGNAIDALLGDPEPVWRVAAAAALTTALHTRTLSGGERAQIRAAMDLAAFDPDPDVRRAVFHMQKLPHSEFAPEKGGHAAP